MRKRARAAASARERGTDDGARGQACLNGEGECSEGLDVITCGKVLEKLCGTNYVNYGALLDDNGGHANVYHFHTSMAGEISMGGSTPTGHSPLIGIAGDGRGVFGPLESSGTYPTDLDACGGHYGGTPNRTVTDSTGASVTFAGGSDVYHYHLPTLQYDDFNVRTTLCVGSALAARAALLARD